VPPAKKGQHITYQSYGTVVSLVPWKSRYGGLLAFANTCFDVIEAGGMAPDNAMPHVTLPPPTLPLFPTRSIG
jgi:hypothetical protein